MGLLWDWIAHTRDKNMEVAYDFGNFIPKPMLRLRTKRPSSVVYWM